MRLSVNPNDKTPIYRQLYEQIASEVLSGTLSPGTPLPPIRTVSNWRRMSSMTSRSVISRSCLLIFPPPFLSVTSIASRAAKRKKKFSPAAASDLQEERFVIK